MQAFVQESIEETLNRLTNLMVYKKITLTTAESCTGGLVSSFLTKNAGSSRYFRGSICAYDNNVKSRLLGVPSALIKAHGAVSEPVAIAMAQGVLFQIPAILSLSITGIAGPGGGTPTKPVGTICYAILSPKACDTNTVFLNGSREQVRYTITKIVLEQSIAHIKRWL